MNRRKFLLGALRSALVVATPPLVSLLSGVGGAAARIFPTEIPANRVRDLIFTKILRAKRILDGQNVTAPRYLMLARRQVKLLFGETEHPRILGFEIVLAEASDQTLRAWGGGINVFVDSETGEPDVWREADYAELRPGKWIGGQHA